MLELEQALARILELLPPPQPEQIPLNEACGRILSQAIISRLDLPGFDNSSMDGYAARAADVSMAKSNAPVRLRLIGRVAAGESFKGSVGPGTCVRLFTGSALPEGGDCVVMQEDTQVDAKNPEEILVLEGARPWENVRLRGEDVRAGTAVAVAGQVLSASRLSLLASLGEAKVEVARQPVVGLIATGSELREPGQPLAAGQIYESNRVGIAALLHRCGAKPLNYAIVKDSLEATRKALSLAFSQCDVVLTIGGASVGELDLVRPAFTELGGELEFWKIAIKPGRPFAFGRLDGRFLFSLPGNPVSAFVTFLLLVRPAVLKWQGAANPELRGLPGILAEPLFNPGTRRHFMRVKLAADGNVTSTGPQGSHFLSSLAAASGLVEVPPETTLAAGSRVLVRTWEI